MSTWGGVNSTTFQCVHEESLIGICIFAVFLFRVPTVREKSGKSEKFKVRERSGNFKLSQGNLKYLQMLGKSQGIPELGAESGAI